MLTLQTYPVYASSGSTCPSALDGGLVKLVNFGRDIQGFCDWVVVYLEF